MPSGPPAEPDGEEDIALAFSSVETCSAAKRSELFGSHGVLLSIGADGCLCLSAARVSGVSNAGLSSLQIRWIPDLKSPSSSLLATIDAKNLSGSYLFFWVCELALAPISALSNDLVPLISNP